MLKISISCNFFSAHYSTVHVVINKSGENLPILHLGMDSARYDKTVYIDVEFSQTHQLNNIDIEISQQQETPALILPLSLL